MELRYKRVGSRILPVADQVVYAVQCAGFVKIGVTTVLEERIGGIQTGNPFECVLLGSIPGGIEVEKKIHAHLAEHRERGEWFRLDNDDVIEVVRMIMHKDMSALDRFMPDEDEIERQFKELIEDDDHYD